MRKRARKNAVQRSITKWILRVYHSARINRSKTKQDTSSSRRARIRRRERTYPYASKTKRKLDDEMRRGFFGLTTQLVPSEVKQSKTRVRQGGRGFFDGSLLCVNEREKTQSNAVLRSGFSVLLLFFFLANGYPNRRAGEVVGTANGVFQITLVGEMEKAFVVDE